MCDPLLWPAGVKAGGIYGRMLQLYGDKCVSKQNEWEEGRRKRRAASALSERSSTVTCVEAKEQMDQSGHMQHVQTKNQY